MRAKRAGVALWALLLSWPVATAHPRFFQITTPLSISAEKSHPPYIAFMEAERLRLRDEWDLIERQPATELRTEPMIAPAPVTVVSNAVLRLEPMRISIKETTAPPPLVAAKSPVSLPSSNETRASAFKLASASAPIEASEKQDWIEKLSRMQQTRLIEAQQRSRVLDENWDSATEEPAPSASSEASAGPESVVLSKIALNSSLEIVGRVEVAGLQFGPGRRLEVVRSHEGVDVEQGSVDLKDGTYAIRPTSRAGEIIARVKDENGHSIGEDRFYLSQIRETHGRVQGPSLSIAPTTDLGGSVTSFYPGRAIASVKATVLAGAASPKVAKSGDLEFNGLSAGSVTVMTAEAKDHVRTVSLAHAGGHGDWKLFPAKWMESLKNIVSEQRQTSLDDPSFPVVWGRVTLDGKPRAGMTVEMESAEGLEPVYFNQFLLPDPNLKATAENGLYAFVGAPEGFQSLIARAGDAYFAHQNVVVQEGAVSIGDLASTIRTETSMIRVYDAFTGEPRPTSFTHQGIEQVVEIDGTGTAMVSLPVLRRLSLVQADPPQPYSRATYLPSDDDGYIHLPLVREDWIRAMQAWAKIDDSPMGSVVVGFVPDEAFTAEALDPAATAPRVLYFDAVGQPSPRGVQGGGFIVFGLSPGVREVVVTGERSGLIATRVFPSDARALTVLSYRLE